MWWVSCSSRRRVHAIKGQKAKQPDAMAMADNSTFCLAGIWENWKHPQTNGWRRTFSIIITTGNDLVGQIHAACRCLFRPTAMTVGRPTSSRTRELLILYPSDLMQVRVNDDIDLLAHVPEPLGFAVLVRNLARRCAPQMAKAPSQRSRIKPG